MSLKSDQLEILLGVYPAELQLNKANASDTEAVFLDLNLSTNNDAGATKYDKQ